MEQPHGVEELRGYVLACRDEGHRWIFVEDLVTENRGRVSEFEQVRKCGSCETVRSRVIECVSFTVVGTTYTYPEGYLFAKGVRVQRSEIRREVVGRATEGKR